MPITVLQTWGYRTVTGFRVQSKELARDRLIWLSTDQGQQTLGGVSAGVSDSEMSSQSNRVSMLLVRRVAEGHTRFATHA